MGAFQDAFAPLTRTALVEVLSLGAAVAFVLTALNPESGPEGSFAALAVVLALAAALGPFLYSRRPEDRGLQPLRRGLLRCVVISFDAALFCGIYGAATGGSFGAAALAGLFCGLYAWSLGGVADLLGRVVPPLGARSLVALLGIALLGTLLYWDDLFLLHAEDRGASVATALALNPLASAAHTLGFEWAQAPELYRHSETAESVAGLPQKGLLAYSLQTAIVGISAAFLGAAAHLFPKRAHGA